MEALDLATLIAFHHIFRDKGTSAEQVGWHSVEEQQKRFDVLTSIAPLAGCTILDAGCGFGDLWAYLLSTKYDRLPVKYWGFDCLPRFIGKARQRWKSDPRVSIGAGDLYQSPLPRADYVFASGSLSYQSRTPDWPYVAIRRLYAACDKGFAFNLLKEAEGSCDRYLCTYSPNAITTFCRRIARKVICHQDYSPEDFTIYMYR
jgi:SAM-dependent methyltransferase